MDSNTFAARPGGAYPRVVQLPAREQGAVRAKNDVITFDSNRDVDRLRGRLARALGNDPSVRLAWLHGSWARGAASDPTCPYPGAGCSGVPATPSQRG